MTQARTTVRLALAIVAGIAATLASCLPTLAEDRSLTLYHTHTRESATITFKRDGRYDGEGLSRLNTFLRDWRTGEPTRMDPALFDLLWAVYGDVGASQPIHVVSSYRSPATNANLRANSSGVAENSQHITGKAMDFYIPGVRLATLRAAAMRRQGGGVGYYPSSGSPFVHLDTGSVRAWPRMTTAQLLEIFPDGKTAHLPSDGGPLPGHAAAVADLSAPPAPAQPAEAPRQPNLLERLFGGKQEPPAQPAPQVAVAAAPEYRLQPTPGMSFAGDLAPQVPKVSPVVPPRRPESTVAFASFAPAPAPRPTWRDRAVVAEAPAAEVAVIEGDYALLGYADTRKALEEPDPFAFLLDLRPAPAVRGVARVPAVTTATPAEPLEVAADVSSGLPGELHRGVPLTDTSFAGFSAPYGQTIPFALATSDPRVAGRFEAYRGQAPRRF